MARLLYEVKDEIAWIRLNRPEVLNALSSEELRAFVAALREAVDDPEVKAIIISSVGNSFCAGEDLKIALEEYPRIRTGEIHPILDIVEDITEGLQAIPRIIRMARKVVIASVRGLAVGGGFEIAIDSDLIVAADDARFGFPEGNAGMTVTGGATKLLPMSVGLNKGRELVLTGEFIDAAEAHRIGLVNRVVPAGQEDEEAERLARHRHDACASVRRQPQASPAARGRNRPRGDPGAGEADRHEHDLHGGLRRGDHRIR